MRSDVCGGRANRVLLLACVGQFMVVLDVSVVNVALPAIQAALGRIDVPGAMAATIGLAALTYGIIGVQNHGVARPVTVTALLVGFAALALFIVIEVKFARLPLVPPRLFRNRAVSVGNIVMLLAGASFQVPMWYFLTLYMQHVLGYSALQTGLAFLPHTLITILGVRMAPLLMRYVSNRALVIAGATLAAVGFLWQSRISPDSGYLTDILAPAVVFSLGGGLLNTPLTATTTAGVPTSDAGAASGLMNTTKQAGGALGLAVTVTVAASRGHTPEELTEGYSEAFLAMALMLAIAAIVAVAIPRERAMPTHEPRQKLAQPH